MISCPSLKTASVILVMTGMQSIFQEKEVKDNLEIWWKTKILTLDSQVATGKNTSIVVCGNALIHSSIRVAYIMDMQFTSILSVGDWNAIIAGKFVAIFQPTVVWAWVSFSPTAPCCRSWNICCWGSDFFGPIGSVYIKTKKSFFLTSTDNSGFTWPLKLNLECRLVWLSLTLTYEIIPQFYENAVY